MNDKDLERMTEEYIRRERHFVGTDTYTYFNPGNLFAIQQRQRITVRLLRTYGLYPLANERILEIGCGSGTVLLEYLAYDAMPKNLHGIDLLRSRLALAQPKLPHLPVSQADAQRLPYADDSFDLILQYTVFTSILDDGIRRGIAQEMLRVLRKSGMLLWYDFWLNPTNSQTRGIRPEEIRHLFPGCTYDFRRITLAPPIARWLAPSSWLACHLLEQLRIFNTHYLVAIRPGQVPVSSRANAPLRKLV